MNTPILPPSTRQAEHSARIAIPQAPLPTRCAPPVPPNIWVVWADALLTVALDLALIGLDEDDRT